MRYDLHGCQLTEVSNEQKPLLRLFGLPVYQCPFDQNLYIVGDLEAWAAREQQRLDEKYKMQLWNEPPQFLGFPIQFIED